jgi:hypothetical protein
MLSGFLPAQAGPAACCVPEASAPAPLLPAWPPWCHPCAQESLGCLAPSLEPRATDFVPQMVATIERIIANGHAYAVGGDVFFDVASLPGYGRLSGRSQASGNALCGERGRRRAAPPAGLPCRCRSAAKHVWAWRRVLRVPSPFGPQLTCCQPSLPLLQEDNRAGERVAVDERKRGAADFALWKAAKPGEPTWDSPWGAGRPGGWGGSAPQRPAGLPRYWGPSLRGSAAWVALPPVHATAGWRNPCPAFC